MQPIHYPYFLLFGIINALSIYRWKKFSTADKFIALLIAITTIEEVISVFATVLLHNNLWVFHIYSPVEFLMISLYFNYTISAFTRKKTGLIVGLAGVIVGLINTLFIQHILTINSYFLLFEGTAIIIYCLLAFHQILMNDEHVPYRFAHFWLTICFLIYWSSTFTGWGIYTVLNLKDSVIAAIFDQVLKVANFIFYIGIASIFIFYKKLIPSGA